MGGESVRVQVYKGARTRFPRYEPVLSLVTFGKDRGHVLSLSVICVCVSRTGTMGESTSPCKVTPLCSCDSDFLRVGQSAARTTFS